MRELLTRESGGVIFTTLQKFFPEEKGGRLEALSVRRNIVVIADEAHRSQYDLIDGYARHLRDALPNASFIGFTGTPIEQADANTRAIFGDYIDVYDIQKAVKDGATVPIYYEQRLAKLAPGRRPAPAHRPRVRRGHRGRGGSRGARSSSPSGRSSPPWWARPSGVKAVAADIVEHFEARLRDGHGRQGHDRRHVAADRGGALRRDRGAAPRVAGRGRGRRVRERHHDRLRERRARVAAAHPQQVAARGDGHQVPRPRRPVQVGDRARHVAHRLRRARRCTRCTSTSRCAGTG